MTSYQVVKMTMTKLNSYLTNPNSSKGEEGE